MRESDLLQIGTYLPLRQISQMSTDWGLPWSYGDIQVIMVVLQTGARNTLDVSVGIRLQGECQI